MVINHIWPIQALAIGAAEPWDFFFFFGQVHIQHLVESSEICISFQYGHEYN